VKVSLVPFTLSEAYAAIASLLEPRTALPNTGFQGNCSKLPLLYICNCVQLRLCCVLSIQPFSNDESLMTTLTLFASIFSDSI